MVKRASSYSAQGRCDQIVTGRIPFSRAMDCGSEGWGFDSPHSPHLFFLCYPDKINKLQVIALTSRIGWSYLNNPVFAGKADAKPDSPFKEQE